MERLGDLLFVYGTLKRGLTNHHQLGDAPCLGEVQMPGVRLHDLGPFPMAVLGEGQARGELYRVAARQLARLDRFEGVPRLYRRECLRLADGRQAWIYLGQPRQVRHSPWLQAGCWPAPVADPISEGAGAALEAPRPQGFLGCRRRGPGHSRRRLLAMAGPHSAERLSGRLALAPWPRRLPLLLALIALLGTSGLETARAEASLVQCRRWQNSSGLEQILLGNAIGAAAYLTKVQRFAQSDPDHPQLLYAPTDLQRACDGWR